LKRLKKKNCPYLFHDFGIDHGQGLRPVDKNRLPPDHQVSGCQLPPRDRRQPMRPKLDENETSVKALVVGLRIQDHVDNPLDKLLQKLLNLVQSGAPGDVPDEQATVIDGHGDGDLGLVSHFVVVEEVHGRVGVLHAKVSHESVASVAAEEVHHQSDVVNGPLEAEQRDDLVLEHVGGEVPHEDFGALGGRRDARRCPRRVDSLAVVLDDLVVGPDEELLQPLRFRQVFGVLSPQGQFVHGGGRAHVTLIKTILNPILMKRCLGTSCRQVCSGVSKRMTSSSTSSDRETAGVICFFFCIFLTRLINTHLVHWTSKGGVPFSQNKNVSLLEKYLW
jgi:hypothetical protein